jgi:hypothetical protein
MKTIWFFPFMLLLFIIPHGMAQPNLSYTDLVNGFKINYPATWHLDMSKQSSNLESIIIASPDGRGQGLVSVSILSTPLSIKNLQTNQFKIISITDSTLSEHLAKRITGVMSYRGAFSIPGVQPHDVKMLVYYVNHEDKFYMVAYMASPDIYPDYLSAAAQIINSFQVIDSGGK